MRIAFDSALKWVDLLPWLGGDMRADSRKGPRLIHFIYDTDCKNNILPALIHNMGHNSKWIRGSQDS